MLGNNRSIAIVVNNGSIAIVRLQWEYCYCQVTMGVHVLLLFGNNGHYVGYLDELLADYLLPFKYGKNSIWYYDWYLDEFHTDFILHFKYYMHSPRFCYGYVEGVCLIYFHIVASLDMYLNFVLITCSLSNTLSSSSVPILGT